MSATIGIETKNNSTLFYLENDTDQPIAVQASLARREMDINGKESNPKTTDELVLYPSQLIIPANEKRSVKVSWVGKNVPIKELAYRLIAEQLPIELEKIKNKKASIKVLLRYVAALYVNADDYESAVRVEELKVNNKKVQFNLENSGKKHQVLMNLNLKLVNELNKKEINLGPEDLKGMSGENILAESKRIFTFPQTGKFLDITPDSKVKISFDKD